VVAAPYRIHEFVYLKVCRHSSLSYKPNVVDELREAACLLQMPTVQRQTFKFQLSQLIHHISVVALLSAPGLKSSRNFDAKLAIKIQLARVSEPGANLAMRIDARVSRRECRP
jgi:hypothetical protein